MVLYIYVRIRYTIYDLRCTMYEIWYDTIYDMIWYMAWHGMAWHGMTWHDMIWHMMWCDVVWCGVAWCGVRCGAVWCGLVWCGMVWYGMVWYGDIIEPFTMKCHILPISQNRYCYKFLHHWINYAGSKFTYFELKQTNQWWTTIIHSDHSWLQNSFDRKQAEISGLKILNITKRHLWHQWPLLLTWFNFNPSMDK